ncbi:MAG: LPS assembly lipoprotein LptE [Balneolaceae bacterium]
MLLRSAKYWMAAVLLTAAAGCFNYSFTGTSIPSDVNTVYLPFFEDRSGGGLGDISDRLNRSLINRFVNQSRLSMTNNQDGADAVVQGVIQSYQDRPFSVGGDEQADLNEVAISVRASFRYADDEEPLWDKNFTGTATYDVRENPVDGEVAAAEAALQQIANNMFNDAVSNW